MHRFNLRWWALRQFLYCGCLMTVETLKSLRSAVADKQWRRPRFTHGDLWISFREDIVRTVARGHLNRLSFICLDDEYPELRSKIFLTTDRLVAIGVDNLERIERAGRKVTGTLAGYAASQRRHLEACEACRSFVCGTFVGDAVEAKQVKDILRQAGFHSRREDHE